MGTDLMTRLPPVAVLALLHVPLTLSAQEPWTADSSGVAIVTSYEPTWVAGEEWSLSTAPIATYGGPGVDLWRVSGLAVAGDSLVVVVSMGYSTIHVFDRRGQPLYSFGREGPGPGDLEWPTRVAVSGDSLLVLDRSAIEVFLLDGTHQGTESLPRSASDEQGHTVSAIPLDFLTSRDVLFAVGRVPSEVNDGEFFRPDQGLGARTVGSPEIELLAWYEGVEQVRVDIGGRSTIVHPPFAGQSIFRIGPDSTSRFVAADTRRYQVDLYDSTGRLRTVLRREVESQTVRPQWVGEWRRQQRQMDWTRGQLPVLERAWDRMPVPETVPPIEDLVVDALGYLWVMRPNVLPAPTVTYDVFSPAAHFLGRVEVPAGMGRLSSPVIGEDTFTAVWVGALGIETVRTYRLRRPGP